MIGIINKDFRYRQYDCNRKYYYNYRQYEEQIINIPEKYKKLLNVKWSHPSVLSNSILLSTPLDKFAYTEKIDGIHSYLLIFNGKIFDVTHNTDFSKIKQIDISNFTNMNFSGDCIIETEFYNKIYFIFDVYYLNDVNYSEKFLYERIDAIRPFLNKLGSSFKLKNFHKIPNINFLLDYIKNDKSPEGNEIDGVILQRIDKPFFQEKLIDFYSYKLKPLHLNTIDFLLKFNYKCNNFNLYLYGNYYFDYYNNLKKTPKYKNIYSLENNYQKIEQTYQIEEKILIYFDSPFYPNLGIMNLDKNWNKNNYSEKHIKLIDDLIDKMIKNPRHYNNKIVELSLTYDKKWVPLKVRNDKIKPNSYRTGLNNISIIFDPVKPIDSIYFQKNLSMNDEELNIIHKINQTFRKYIVENHVNDFGKNSSVIDLCGGRGADEFNLYSNGVSNFFIIDFDTTALKRYHDRTFNIQKKQYSQLHNKYKSNLKNGKNYINLNFLNYKLDKDYEPIIRDLCSRAEFKKGKVDIVLMNFATHYLCDDKVKLEKLSEFINSVLYNNGIFIITYFDGDEILKRKENNISRIDPFDIEIVKDDKDIALAKMPLPTIKSGNNIYSEEQLVLKNMIKNLEKYLELYSEYYII